MFYFLMEYFYTVLMDDVSRFTLFSFRGKLLLGQRLNI